MKKSIFIFTLLLATLFLHNATAQFMENKGQVIDTDQNFHPEVKFYWGQGGNAMYFEKDRVVCLFAKNDPYDFSPWAGNQKAIDSVYKTLGTHYQRIDIEFLGAASHIDITPGRMNSHSTNFYLNKRENITEVKSFETILYKNVWNNIDIRFYVSDQGIKYDFILNDGAHIEDIRIKYNGASDVQLSNNTLTINTLYQDLQEDIPVSYRNGNSQDIIPVEYTLFNDIISYSTSETFNTLTIDPVLTWATYFETATSGGSIDYDHNIADTDGNLFIYGVAWNTANNYPVVDPGGGAYIMNHVNNNGYLAKFNPSRTLVWATYFGGSTDIDWSLGTNVMEIYGTTLHIIGDQLSSDAPKPNGGGFYYTIASTRPFWARFNKNTGVMEHCTNIGGHTSSYPSIAVSNSGLVSIIMSTYDFAVVHLVNRAGAYNQATNGGFQDVFLYLFNSSYNQIWGTWLGGPGTQESSHVTFDTNDNIFYVVESQWMSGSTEATERLVNPGGGAWYQNTNFAVDLMIGKFTSAGVLYWNTLYGGSSRDGTRGNFGNGSRVYTHPTTNELLVTAGTMSTNLPLQVLTGAYNLTCPSYITGGGGMCSEIGSFILKFSNTGLRQWATYWGDGSGGCNLLYNAHYTDCDKLILGARSSSASISYPGYYNQATGQQAYLMQLSSSTYAAEWASKIGVNTGVPKIAYTPYQTRLYLSAVTSSQLETTLNPGGGAFYDGSFVGPHWGSYYITEFNIIPGPVLGDTTICEGETVTINVSGGVGTNYSWYTTPTGGTPFHTGNSWTSPALYNDTTFYVSSSNGTCTSDRTPVTITVTPAPTVTISPSSASICDGESVLLTANGATTYTWSHGLGSGNTQNVSPSVTTTYTVSGSNGGCDGTATVTVNVSSAYDATITPVAPLCADASPFNLSATDAGGTWSGTGITNPSAGTFDPSVAGAGTHTITYGIPGACGDTATTDIIVYALPAITASASPLTACIGEEVILTAGGGVSYDWGTAGTGSPVSVYPTVNTTYTVTGTDGNSCSNTAEVTVTVVDNFDATITPAGPFCSADASVTLSAADPGGTWSGTGITNPTTGTFDPSSAGEGTHTVTYALSGACGDTATTNITVFESPTISATGTDESCTDGMDGSVAISVSGGTAPYTYSWAPVGSGTSTSGLGEGTYTIITTDANGCQRTVVVTLVDPDVPCDAYDPHVVVPTGFSPNGDGQNDVLYVRGEGIVSLEFIVFTRWGEIVFETTNQNIGWDGTYKGKMMDPAVFVYTLKATLSNYEIISLSGDITLVR
jgi:gliding motility-associated-like protein